jgi:hypothetical protein
MFSMRLALRGGEHSVEDTVISLFISTFSGHPAYSFEQVKRVRGEYAAALFGLVLAVELFIVSIPFLCFFQLYVHSTLRSLQLI